MAQLQAGELYKERTINFNAIFVLVGVLFVSILFISSLDIASRRGDDLLTPASIIILVVAIVEVLLAVNLAFLSISITPEGITARYGLFQQKMSWDNIQSYDYRKSGFRASGLEMLWGISIGLIDRKPALYFRASYGKSVVILIERKQGFFKYFGFSTKHYQEIMALLDAWKR